LTRREEVEEFIRTACNGCDDGMEHASALEDQCRLLALEVDALQASFDALARKATSLENDRAERDAVINKLLVMLDPIKKPNYMDSKYNPSRMPPLTEYNLDCMCYEIRKQSHSRACEIAGRKEKMHDLGDNLPALPPQPRF
jgi:hypothetical protein